MHVVFVYFEPFQRNSLLECSPQLKTQNSLINPLFWVSRLFKVADFMGLMGLSIIN